MKGTSFVLCIFSFLGKISTFPKTTFTKDVKYLFLGFHIKMVKMNPYWCNFLRPPISPSVRPFVHLSASVALNYLLSICSYAVHKIILYSILYGIDISILDGAPHSVKIHSNRTKQAIFCGVRRRKLKYLYYLLYSNYKHKVWEAVVQTCNIFLICSNVGPRDSLPPLMYRATEGWILAHDLVKVKINFLSAGCTLLSF